MDSVITVIVSPEKDQATFLLREIALRQTSDFFNNALKPGWKEAKEKTVHLPETDPRHFAIFAKLICTSKIFIPTEADRSSSRQNKSADEVHSCFEATYDTIIDLICLSSFLQSRLLQDAALDTFIEAIAEYRVYLENQRIWFNGSWVAYMYERTLPGSAVRKFVVDLSLHAWSSDIEDYPDLDLYPAEFCRQVINETLPYMRGLKELKELKDGVDPVDIATSCRYHEHTLNGDVCYKEKSWHITRTDDMVSGASIYIRGVHADVTINRRV